MSTDCPQTRKTQIGVIWAQAADRVIGADGDMPWHLPEDLAHFKQTTLGRPVLMGRRTWESFPPRFRPLPGRTNVVLTRSPEAVDTVGTAESPVLVAADWARAVALASDAPGGEQVWVIGGGSVYDQAMADPVHPARLAVVTEIALEVPGDVRAPALGPEWELVEDGPWQRSRTGLGFRVRRWTR